MKPRDRHRLDLIQGTLEMIVLRTLTWGPQHGYGISQIIRVGSGEVLQAEAGSLYPALHRLERQKLVTAEWKQSENNQRTKVYRLTAAGRKRLAEEHDRWERLHAAIDGLMRAKGSPA
jgi:PadR family transcriptional regulator PadR